MNPEENKKPSKSNNNAASDDDALEILPQEEQEEESLDPIEKLKKEFESELGEKTKALEDWKKKYTLLQADFENYQKRMEKNRAHIQDIERASILRSFLKIIDSFEKALEHIQNEESKNASNIKSIYNQIINEFKSYRVERIASSKGDIFDYRIHEAISFIENPDLPENSIIDIVQTGWKIDKEILRYVKVVISKFPKIIEPEKKKEEGEIKETEQEEVGNLKDE